MSYSITVNGHSAKMSADEVIEETKKFIGALDGVNYAAVSTDKGLTDLTPPKEGSIPA